MPVKWFPSFVSVLGDGTYYGTAADHQLTIENASKRHGRDLEHGAPAHPPKHGRRSWLFLNPVSGFFKFLFGSKGNDIELSAPNRATIQTTTPSSAAVPTETRVLQEIQHQGYTDNTDGATSLSTSRVRRAGDTRHSGFPDPAPGPSRTPSHIVPALRIPPHKLDYLRKGLREIVAELDHHEVWGIDLHPENSLHGPTNLVLAKFLQANDGDPITALLHLRRSVTWRKQYQPRKYMKKAFDRKKFSGLGYVHDRQGVDRRVVVIFDLYGSAHHDLISDAKCLDEFICWRVVLMEMALDRLRMGSLRELSNCDVADSYKIINVIDLTGLHRAYWRYWGSRHRAVLKMFLNSYPDLVSQIFVVADIGLQFDISDKPWQYVPGATRQRFTFFEVREDVASQLPLVVGKWPKEFSTDDIAPPVCSGLGPNLDMGNGKDNATDDPNEPPALRVRGDEPSAPTKRRGVLRRRGPGTTRALLEIESA